MSPPVIHPAVVSGYGLIDASFDRVTRTLGTHARSDGSTTRVLAHDSSLGDALAYLDVRTHPATRLALLDLDGWTAVVTNHRGGSDFADHQQWTTRATSARTVRVVDREARWWRRGRLRERLAWEAWMFELRGPDGGAIRSIACANDGGRWTFDASGDPLSIEAAAPYDAARTRDRFTREHLRGLLAGLGPGALTPERFVEVRRFALLAERIGNDSWRARTEDRACTLKEADDPAYGYFMRGLSWMPHLETHATSVIRDFERAMELNPEYEPKVRDHLDEARRLVSTRRAG